MIKPMLAAPLHKGNIVNWTDWTIEQKYDGHRMIVSVADGRVVAYARPRGKDDRQLVRALPNDLARELSRLPNGLYDGELLGGDTATDVTRLDLAGARTFVVFDLIVLRGASVAGRFQCDRRATLERIFEKKGWHRVSLAVNFQVTSQHDVDRFVKAVWASGGEGAILKRKESLYHAGKRTPDWLKIKRVEHATLTVVGFKPSKGTVRFPGHPFAIVRLRDDDGNETSCKTLNDEELDAFTKQWRESKYAQDHPVYIEGMPHPAIGRQLVIEFFGRTRDGGYKGPVTWDRWEDE